MRFEDVAAVYRLCGSGSAEKIGKFFIKLFAHALKPLIFNWK